MPETVSSRSRSIGDSRRETVGKMHATKRERRTDTRGRADVIYPSHRRVARIMKRNRVMNSSLFVVNDLAMRDVRWIPIERERERANR